MKKQSLLLFLSIAISVATVSAQSKEPAKKEIAPEVSVINAQLDMFKGNVGNQMQVTDLEVERFDRISVFNKQGAVLIKKTVNTSIAHMDLSQLEEGVYLLGLSSSSTLKEKTIKFIISR